MTPTMPFKSTRILALTIIACAALSATALADKIAVTVYNSDLGVVREVRELEFSKGTGTLSFQDVPSRIDATSVGFTPLDAPGQISILEQNYQYDLVSPDKLYQRYIDNAVELFSKDGKIYSGELMSYNGGSVILADRSGRIQIVQMGDIANVNLPELPSGLITRPTLIWNYSSQISGKSRCEVSYQTSGMNWSAEYVASLNEQETKLHLSGWASITNNCGKTFNDATLKLVAGDIHRAQQRYPDEDRMYKTMAMEAAGAPGFEEKAFFEYHLYTLPRPSTVANNEIKQLSLFEPSSAGVQKEYVFTSTGGNTDVDVKLKFTNSEANGLGMPLPAGRVRVFKNDSDGSSILLGEDRIDHTPRDEELTLTIGKAFDIVAEEVTVDRRAISNKVTEFDFKITLKNRKDTAVTVKVVKNLGADWEILKNSHDYTKKSAYEIEMQIPVKARQETDVLLTVRYVRP